MNNSSNPNWNNKLPMMVKRSALAGRDHHQNSNYFDHFEHGGLKNEFHTPEVDRVTVFHTHNIIVGIECHYKSLNKENVATLSNRGHFNGQVQTSTLQLDFGEYIEEISGRGGDSIDKLVIKTNKKKVLEVGGNGGQPFNNILPWGIPKIAGFGGSTRDFLDSIYVLYR